MFQSAPVAQRNLIRRVGRSLEPVVRRFRSYLTPAHIWAYWKISRRHAPGADAAGGNYVWFDFTRVDIDYENGRYGYGLVRDFEALGYLICFRRNFRFLANMQHKTQKRLLLDRPFRVCRSADQLPGATLVAEVTDRARPPAVPHRQIRIRYEPVWPQSDREVAMTYFVHPRLQDRLLAAAAPDLAARRHSRVFFAGGMMGPRYGTDALPGTFGKMSRVQILRTLTEGLPPDRLRRALSAADLKQDDAGHPCFVWANSREFKIPQAEWLDTLKLADFFLACPGMEMPLCHNLIESLSQGAVPILEHPEFLDPPLEHGVNCVVFRGHDALMPAVEQTFRFSPEEIERLRRGAYAYYQKYLAPGRFAQRLLDHPHSRVDLLLNSYRAPRAGAGSF